MELPLDKLLALVQKADTAIMDIYNAHSAVVNHKADDTPITQADVAAHHILVDGLQQLFPDVPVISEEGDQPENVKLIQQNKFWLVDPIDGTREFIKRTDDFTVCLALVEGGMPVFGIISAPAHSVVYWGGPATGSYKKESNGEPRPIHVADHALNTVLISRSSLDPLTGAYITKYYPSAHMMEVGSQLKLPYIAEGKADAYPRIGSTMHPWDLAPGQAILAGAGGSVKRPDGAPVDYQAANLQVGDFVASRTA
jgi:3'(2'), 5'-bisphosphate nucleotidase